MKDKKTSPKERPLKTKGNLHKGGAPVPGIQIVSKTPDSPPAEPQRGAPVPGIQPIPPTSEPSAPEPQPTPSVEPAPQSPPPTEPSDE